jgi:hypothetical protein
MYQPLQKLLCTVKRQLTPTSYDVLIKHDNLPAELICIFQLQEGEEVWTLFGTGSTYPMLAIAEDSEIWCRPRHSSDKQT